MASAADRPTVVSSVELAPDVGLAPVEGTPVEFAMQLTEAALGQLMRVVVENIRQGGNASAHVEAAERDLRSALRQLSLIQRTSATR